MALEEVRKRQLGIKIRTKILILVLIDDSYCSRKQTTNKEI